jgi:acyl-CoA thioester hydrolase
VTSPSATRAALSDAGPTDRVPPFRFSVRFRVELADTDLGAVVYYGRYPQFVDRATIAYRRHMGVEPLGPPGHLFVVRALTLEYSSSARFDDELEVFVRTVRLGATSHTIDVRIERPGDGAALVAAGRFTVVGLESYGGRPSRMPAEMRDAIIRFEGGAIETA